MQKEFVEIEVHTFTHITHQLLQLPPTVLRCTWLIGDVCACPSVCGLVTHQHPVKGTSCLLPENSWILYNPEQDEACIVNEWMCQMY